VTDKADVIAYLLVLTKHGMVITTNNILDLIGNTPTIQLRGEQVFAKAEFLNPGGSIKDRVALAMIEGAERKGVLKKGSTVVEPTSGNTGIGTGAGFMDARLRQLPAFGFAHRIERINIIDV